MHTPSNETNPQQMESWFPSEPEKRSRQSFKTQGEIVYYLLFWLLGWEKRIEESNEVWIRFAEFSVCYVDSSKHTQFCLPNDRMNFLFTLIAAYCLLCLDYFPFKLFTKYLIKKLEGKQDEEESVETEMEEQNEISEAIRDIWNSCDEITSFNEYEKYCTTAENEILLKENGGSRFGEEFVATFEANIECYLQV